MTTQDEPRIVADDSTCMNYSDARRAWEAGEFSEWAESHGFPLTIDGIKFPTWEGVEDALSDDQWDEDEALDA